MLRLTTYETKSPLTRRLSWSAAEHTAPKSAPRAENSASSSCTSAWWPPSTMRLHSRAQGSRLSLGVVEFRVIRVWVWKPPCKVRLRSRGQGSRVLESWSLGLLGYGSGGRRARCGCKATFWIDGQRDATQRHSVQKYTAQWCMALR